MFIEIKETKTTTGRLITIWWNLRPGLAKCALLAEERNAMKRDTQPPTDNCKTEPCPPPEQLELERYLAQMPRSDTRGCSLVLRSLVLERVKL